MTQDSRDRWEAGGPRKGVLRGPAYTVCCLAVGSEVPVFQRIQATFQGLSKAEMWGASGSPSGGERVSSASGLVVCSCGAGTGPRACACEAVETHFTPLSCSLLWKVARTEPVSGHGLCATQPDGGIRKLLALVT